jgi:hypothetical protein
MTDLIAALEYKYSLWKENKRKYYQETIDNYKLIDERYGRETLVKLFTDFLSKIDDNN